MNMKKISRILSMVMVVGMIAAIPASTQILSGSGGESFDESNLSMLILVNRLELSEEQMEELRDILTGLLEDKDGMDALRAEFEESMINFSGTGEELDELLATFREDQGTLTEAMRESIESSLDEARDLLSINQGIALREALPSMLGRDTSRASGSIPSLPMGRADMMEQMQQAPRGAQPRIQSPLIGGAGTSGRSSSFDEIPDRFTDRSMASRMQERFDGDSMPEMLEERFGEQVPEALRERMENRFDGDSFSTQRPQAVHGDLFSGQGDLLGLLEQVVEVLELKLAAIE